MGVRSQLPEGELHCLIHEVETMNNEIKAPQTIGSSGVMTSAVQSANSVDITVPANDARYILLQFTPADVSFGGGLAFRAYHKIDGGGYSEIDPSFRLRVGAGHVQSWRIFVGNGSWPSPRTYKFLIIFIGSGTFTASLVS